MKRIKDLIVKQLFAALITLLAVVHARADDVLAETAFAVKDEWAAAVPIDQVAASGDDSKTYGFLTSGEIQTARLEGPTQSDTRRLTAAWSAFQKLNGLSPDASQPAMVLVLSEVMTQPCVNLLDSYNRDGSAFFEAAADNPLAQSSAGIAGRHILFHLRNLSSLTIPPFGRLDWPFRLGIRGRAKRTSDQQVRIEVDRVVFVPPMAPRNENEREDWIGVNANAVENGHQIKVVVSRLRIIGNDEFFQSCLLECPTLKCYVDACSDYDKYVLCAPLASVTSATEGLAKDVQELLQLSQEKTTNSERLRFILEGKGLAKKVARDEAVEIVSRKGERIVRQLEQLFSGNESPLELSLGIASSRHKFAAAVSPVSLGYASKVYSPARYVALRDSEWTYLCQLSTEIRLHSALLQSFRWQDALTREPRTEASDTDWSEKWSELRREVLQTDAADWPHWSSAKYLINRLPVVPPRPREPQDPYVADAIAARGTKISQQIAAQQQREKAGVESLKRDSLRAQARGDGEGFFEAQAAIGAAAALQTGDQTMIDAYGGQAVARAKLSQAASDSLPSFQNVPLELETRPTDYRTSRQWIAYEKERVEYASQLSQYELATKAYKEAVEAVASSLRPGLVTRKALAIEELKRLEPKEIELIKFRQKYEKGSRVVKESQQRWLIPSIGPLVGLLNETASDVDRLRVSCPP